MLRFIRAVFALFTRQPYEDCCPHHTQEQELA